MKVTRENKIATMVVELDNPVENNTIEAIASLNEILYITGINPIER